MSQKTQDKGVPEAIHTLLDTDLYKLTMQAALLQHYPNIGSPPNRLGPDMSEASYIYINRKKNMKLTYEAYIWLESQIMGASSYPLFR